MPAAPTRADYTFNGWYTAASGGTKRGDAGATYTPSITETLYAQWTADVSLTWTLNTEDLRDSQYRAEANFGFNA